MDGADGADDCRCRCRTDAGAGAGGCANDWDSGDADGRANVVSACAPDATSAGADAVDRTALPQHCRPSDRRLDGGGGVGCVGRRQRTDLWTMAGGRRRRLLLGTTRRRAAAGVGVAVDCVLSCCETATVLRGPADCMGWQARLWSQCCCYRCPTAVRWKRPASERRDASHWSDGFAVDDDDGPGGD